MPVLSIPRVLISGTGCGVGKSFIVTGLAAILRAQGISVSCCTTRSSLPQATLYSHLTRRFARSLDSSLLNHSQRLATLLHAAVGADIILIDGRDGLFDGDSSGSIRGSDAELAIASGTPTIIVADGKALSMGIGALLRGYQEVLPALQLAGLIANWVSPKQERANENGLPIKNKTYFTEAMDFAGMGAPLGSVPRGEEAHPLPAATLTEHSRVGVLPRQFIVDLTMIMRSHLDIDQILAVARSAPPTDLPVLEIAPRLHCCRIAVSDDPCFQLTHQDNLDLLRLYGAEIVTFSPLADISLPSRIGAVYLTGGFLGEFAEEIAANKSMIGSIQDFVAKGGVIYSEGSGTAYLSRSYAIDGSGVSYNGVGVIDSDALLQQSHRVPHSVIITVQSDNLLGDQGTTLHGIASDEWCFLDEVAAVETVTTRDVSQRILPEGFSTSARHFSTLLFLHWGSCPEIARSIVDAASLKTM